MDRSLYTKRRMRLLYYYIFRYNKSSNFKYFVYERFCQKYPIKERIIEHSVNELLSNGKIQDFLIPEFVGSTPTGSIYDSVYRRLVFYTLKYINLFCRRDMIWKKEIKVTTLKI